MLERLKELYARLTAAEDREGALPAPIAAVARWAIVFWRQIVKDRAFNRAASLAFVTLIALVPMLLLVSGILGAAGLLEPNLEAVEAFLFSTFLADIPEVREFLLSGLTRVDLGAMGIIGVAGFLIVTSRLYMMAERFYNEIFGVRVERTLGQRLMNFYFILTAAPIVLGVALLTTSQYLGDGGSTAIRWVSPVLSFAVLFVALKLFPCTRVRWRASFAGALVSGVLLELGGRVFPLYVGLLAGGDPLRILYGSIGLLPVFLIWLQLMWLFVLVGVEVAYVAQNFGSLLEAEREQADEKRHLLRIPTVALALETAARIAFAFERGDGPVPAERLAAEAHSPLHAVQDTLLILEKAAFVVPSERGWTLSRPPEQIRLEAIIAAWRELTSVRKGEVDAVGDSVADALGRCFTGSLADGVEDWIPDQGEATSASGGSSGVGA